MSKFTVEDVRDLQKAAVKCLSGGMERLVYGAFMDYRSSVSPEQITKVLNILTVFNNELNDTVSHFFDSLLETVKFDEEEKEEKNTGE